MSSSGSPSKEQFVNHVNKKLRQDVKVQDSKQCTCEDHDHVTHQDKYMTQLNFPSDHGSELKGWENMPKNINITLQSTMGISNFDQTMYNSTGFGTTHQGPADFKKTQQMGQGAIRIEHSPSMNVIYAKDPVHVHRKTQ